MAGPAVAATAATRPPHRMALRGSLAPAQARSHPDGSVAASSPVSFDLVLSLRNASGAQAFVRAVSSPGSAKFHQYLTDAQWVSRFGPAKATVAKAESWLRQRRLHRRVGREGPAVRARPGVGAAGGARVRGQARLLQGERAPGPAGQGHADASRRRWPARSPARSASTSTWPPTPWRQPGGPRPRGPAGPARSRRRPPGSAIPSRARRTGGRRSTPRTRASCTSPTPIRCPMTSAVTSRPSCAARTGWPGPVAAGNNGKGVTIAIVDAYDSPTLLPDAQKYFRLNDPAHPLKSSQFTNVARRRSTTRPSAPPAAGSTSRRSTWRPRTPWRPERTSSTSGRRAAWTPTSSRR